MKFLVVAVFLVAATGVLAQNPYEYVDDALIQRVGQIIYEYDQKVAASRSSGNTGSFNNGAGYQVGKPEGGSRASNFDYNDAKRVAPQVQQQVYQQKPVARAVQQPQQQFYQQKPVARAVQQPQQQVYQQQPQQQAVYQQFPVSRAVRQPIQPVMQQQQVFQNNRNQRQFMPSAPVQRSVQEPQVSQKNSGFGYVLSEPEIVPRVAEFHFTDGVEDSQSQDSFRGNQMSNKRY